MAFDKRTWIARQGVGLNKFRIGDSQEAVTLINDPDEVTVQGDAISATNLNDLEERIRIGFDTQNYPLGNGVKLKEFVGDNLIISVENDKLIIGSEEFSIEDMGGVMPQNIYLSLLEIGGGAGGGGGGGASGDGAGGNGGTGGTSTTSIYVNSLVSYIVSEGGVRGIRGIAGGGSGQVGGNSGNPTLQNNAPLKIFESGKIVCDIQGLLHTLEEITLPENGQGGNGGRGRSSSESATAGSAGINGGGGGGGGSNTSSSGDRYGAHGGKGGDLKFFKTFLRIAIEPNDTITVNFPDIGIIGTGARSSGITGSNGGDSISYAGAGGGSGGGGSSVGLAGGNGSTRDLSNEIKCIISV